MAEWRMCMCVWWWGNYKALSSIKLNVNPINRKKGKEKEKEIRSFSILSYILSSFQNFFSGDLPSFKGRNFLRYLILWEFFRLIIIQTISHLVKQLHILETWHSVLYIIPWCSCKYKVMTVWKKNHHPTTPWKNPSQNMKESNCAWEMLLLPFFSLPSLDKFNLDMILPLLAEAPFVKVRENQNKVWKKPGNKNKTITQQTE